MYRRNEYGEFVSPTVTKTFVSFIGLSLLQQEEEKLAFEYFPGLQFKHSEEASTSEYVPIVHSRHEDSELHPRQVEYFPEEHGWHKLEEFNPSDVEYFPD